MHPTHARTIKLADLTVNFDDRFTLEGIDWRLVPGEHWVVTGPNGSGKSALVAALTGAGKRVGGMLFGVPDQVAVVSFEAQAELIEIERRKDDADLLDVISEGTPVTEIIGTRPSDPEFLERMIDGLGIRGLMTRSFRKLSSGETRKVLLARALASDPELLLLDEPFEGLDAEAHAWLSAQLPLLSERMRMVLVLNRFDEIPDFVTHIAYVDHGRLVHQVARTDADAVADIRQLLHLKTTDLAVPPADPAQPSSGLDAADPLVRLKSARVAYGDNVVFDRLDWEVQPGTHWQVTGPNGSGKTCLLNLITGDHPQCYVNDIFVFGMQRGSGESIWDIKRHVGYVSSALQWEYKVSVSVRNAIISGFHDSIGIYRKFSPEQGDIADRWLALLGMADKAERPFNELSFGDQRLVLIARAMVKHPPLLILDEPCLGLDDINRQLVLALVEKICEGAETTVLYVNHRPEDAIRGIERHLAMTDFAA